MQRGRLLGGLSLLTLSTPAFAQQVPAAAEPAQSSEPQPVDAQPSEASAPPATALDQSSSQEVQALRETVARLESRVAALEGERDKLPAPVPPPDSAIERSSLSDQTSAVSSRSTFREDHHAAPRPGNAAQPPDLDGFFAVGETGLWMKLGGYAKLDLLVDSAATANPNKFATSAIYTSSDAAYDPTLHFNMHAKQSRLSFEARTKTMFGSLRVVYENDFFGDPTGPGMAYNLRHLYGQLGNLTVGQTWTPYLDADAIPDTLDFAGPGAQAIRRSPQVRYTIPLSTATHLAVALEQPGNDIGALPTDATARSMAPDFTLAFRMENEKRGHVHVGGLVRVLSYEDAGGDLFATAGWSTNLSGVFNTFGKDHFVLSAAVGQGMGHYARDLGSGNAAVVTTGGELEALLTWGGFVGYRHFWTDRWTSQVTYGYLELEERDELPGAGYRQTHYAQGNLVWSPEKRFHVGIEYLYGHKTAQDGSAGDDHRAQLSFKFNLF